METAEPLPLAQIIRLALPSGTKLRPANAESRNRQVVWALVVGVPIRHNLMVEQGDLVLCTVRSDEPNWTDSIDQLIAAGAIAVAVNATLPPAALKKADAAHLAIIQLP